MNAARSVGEGDGVKAARAASILCFISPAEAEALLRVDRQRPGHDLVHLAGDRGIQRRGVRIRPWRTSSRTEISLSPGNCRSPVTISKRTAPSEKRSERESTGRPQACSGDMYWSFPLSAPIWVWPPAALLTAFAMPKSQSLTSPS